MSETYDVVFVALARNCAPTVPGAIRGLEAMQSAGLRVHMIVGENGSTDGTRELLETTDLIRVVDTSFMSDVTGRMERMAAGRQFLADQVKDIPTRAVGVVDLDEPFMENLDQADLRSKLDRLETESIFGLSATTRPTYYDLLAFEDDTRSFVGLDHRIGAAQRNPLAYYRLFRDFIYPHQERLTTDQDVMCVSAFNGFCLYPADAYAEGSYTPTGEVCEHVTFNRSIAAATGHNMIIDGSLTLPAPVEHGKRGLVGFVSQRLRKVPAMVRRKVAATVSGG